TRSAGSYRLRREVGRGRSPRHAPTPRRAPQRVRRAEMLMERVGVEVGERARPGDPVDVGRTQPRVGDRPLRGLRADLPGGAPGRLRVRGLADAGDGHLRTNRVEVVRVTPVGAVVGRSVGHARGTYQPPDRAGTAVRARTWAYRSDPSRAAGLRSSLVRRRRA